MPRRRTRHLVCLGLVLAGAWITEDAVRPLPTGAAAGPRVEMPDDRPDPEATLVPLSSLSPSITVTGSAG